MNRRKFLNALGLSAGGLALSSIAKANSNSTPKRFVVFYTQHDGLSFSQALYVVIERQMQANMRRSSSLTNLLHHCVCELTYNAFLYLFL